MRLHTVLEYPTALEDAVHFPQFFLEVGEGAVSGDASSYIDLSKYIHKVPSCDDLYNYIY